MNKEEFVKRFNESGDNEWCSRALSGMYLLHSYTHRLTEELKERLGKYGVHRYEANLLYGRYEQAFNLWERNINGLVTDGESRRRLMEDYDRVAEKLDAFIFGEEESKKGGER